MRRDKVFLAAAIGLGLLTGCVSHQVDDHSFQFNEATGSLGMRLLLLNAVRASKDYPLQFSKISLYQGKGAMGNATLSASLPLKALSAGSLGPKVDWNDGVSRIDLIDLNTEEAQEALKRTLTYNAYAYHTYFSGSRSGILPQFLLLEQVSLSSELADVIDKSVMCTCDLVNHKACDRFNVERERSKTLENYERKSASKLRTLKGRELEETRLKLKRGYDQLKGDLSRLKDSRDEFVKDLKESKSAIVEEIRYACTSIKALNDECADALPRTMDKKTVILKNDLSSECRHKGFMVGLLQSKIIGMTTKAKDKESDKPDEVDKPDSGPGRAKKDDAKKAGGKRPGRGQEEGGNTFNIYTVEQKDKKTPRDEVFIYVLNPIFTLRCLSEELCDTGGESPVVIRKDKISPLLRSPERVVRYLGELISAQNYGTNRYVPRVIDPERKDRFALLLVKRGSPLPSGAAVSIVDPEGETFYVPRRNHDARKEDLSLETLAIVTDVLNAAVSKKNFPPVTTLTVAGP
jgi:hypothetical protein